MDQQIEVTPPTIEKALTKYKIPNATVKALAIFKEAEKLECVDAKSRQIIGKHRADIKTLRPQVNTVRIALNKSFAEKNKDLADIIELALNESYGVFDEKIKTYDSIAEEKRLAKAKIESDRLALVNGYIRALEYDCSPMEYGLSSEKISGEIRFLEEIEISAVDYSDRTDEAEQILNNALSFAKANLESALKFESDQAAAAKLKADNEAAAKKLAEEQAAFKTQQAKTAAAQKKKTDASAKKLADDQAAFALEQKKAKKKTDDAALELKAKQDKLKKDEDDLAAKKQAEIDRQYAAMYDAAIKINLTIINDSAKWENEQFEQDKAQAETDKKDQLKKDKARAKLITHDKKVITGMINVIDTFISEFNCLDGEYKTDEGAQVELDLIIRIKEALGDAEKAGVDLV